MRGRDEVGGLAHAFNAMADSLEAAQDGVVPLDGALIASLLDDAATLRRLVDDLQVLALADAGRLTMHRQPVDAAELVQAVVAQRGAAVAARVRLEADAAVPVALAGDPDHLPHVFDRFYRCDASRSRETGGRGPERRTLRTARSLPGSAPGSAASTRAG